MLVLYKEYRKLYSHKELFETELNQIALREKPRTDSGFIPNQWCSQHYQGMSQDQQLEAKHNCEKNLLEHQKDDQRKREIQHLQINNDVQRHRVIKNKFEFILTLQDGISNLEELIEKTKPRTHEHSTLYSFNHKANLAITCVQKRQVRVKKVLIISNLRH